MKFILSATTLAAIFSAAASQTVGVPFGLITIRSGSALQYASISVDAADNVRAGSTEGTSFVGEFTEDHKVKVGSLYLTVQNKHLIIGTEAATWGDDGEGHLVYDNDATIGFAAVPARNGTGYNMVIGGANDISNNSVSVALRIVYTETSPSLSTSPVSSTAYHNNTTANTTANANANANATATANATAPANTTVATVTAFTTGSGIDQVNGAAQTIIGFGAVVVGAIGALLL